MQRLDKRTSKILKNMSVDLCTFAGNDQMVAGVAYDVARRIEKLLHEQGDA
jgi:hypothetical protein